MYHLVTHITVKAQSIIKWILKIGKPCEKEYINLCKHANKYKQGLLEA